MLNSNILSSKYSIHGVQMPPIPISYADTPRNTDVHGSMRAYRFVGDIQTYKGHPNIMGIQTYRVGANIWGVSKCMGHPNIHGVYNIGVYGHHLSLAPPIPASKVGKHFIT